jgi:sugar/nucleoside kinase (ribokinase family)
MILVVGNLSLERVYRCESLPQTSSGVISVSSIRIGGSGGMIAMAAKKAGADVTLAATVGDDSDSRILRGLISGAGLNATLSVCRDAPTGSSAAFVDDNGGFFRAEAPAVNTLFEAGPDVERLMEGADLIVASCDANARSIDKLVKLARARKIGAILFVPEVRSGAGLGLLAPQADLVVTSDDGFSEIVRAQNPSGMGDFAGEQLHALSDARTGELCRATLKGDVALMMGERGVFVSQRDGSHRLVNMEGRAVGRGARHDATEAFVGCLCAEIAQNRNLVSAVRNALASSVMGH